MAFPPWWSQSDCLEIPLLFFNLAAGQADAEISSCAIRAELMPPVEKSGGYDSQTNVLFKKNAAEP
jgi:hypothetical protein